MLRWLLFIILAAWASRLFQVRISSTRGPRVSDFHPASGAADPPPAAGAEAEPAFSSGEIVDAEFEEIPGPPSP